MTVDPQLLEGDLHDIALPRVLQTLATNQATGILTIQGEDDIIAVSCLKGHIVTADALNQTQEESLGEILVAQSLVSEDDYGSVVREHQSGGEGSLVDMLVGRGLVEREKLLDALRFQTLRLMLQVLTWRKGEFKFYSGDEVSYEKGITPISVDEMLIRALAELGERSGLPGEVPKLEAIYRAVPPRGPIRVLGRDGDGSGGGVWITDLQEAFLQRFDGRASALAIARTLGTGRYKTLFSLYQLLRNDLAEAVGEVPHGVSAPARTMAPRPAAAPAGRPAPPPPSPSHPTAPPSRPAVPPPARPAPPPRPAAPPVARPAAPAAPPTFAPAPSPPAGPSSLAPPPAARVVASPPPAMAPGAPSFATPPPSAPAPSPPAPNAWSARPAEAPRMVQPVAPLPRPWTGPALAGLVLLALVAGLLIRPSAVLLPYSWQEMQRAAVERQLRQSLYRKIDRAAGVYLLMESHYPAALSDLVDTGLLPSVDRRDPTGDDLRYSQEELSYQIDLIEDGQIVEGFGTTGSVTGDFFLDPEYLGPEEVETPLVLLD